MRSQQVRSLLQSYNLQAEQAVQIQCVKFAEKYASNLVDTLQSVKKIYGQIGGQQIRLAYEIMNGIKSDKLQKANLERRQQTIRAVNSSHLTAKQLNQQPSSLSWPANVMTVKISDGHHAAISPNSQITMSMQ